MALDLRDLLRSEMRVHPRLAQQGLFEGAEARAQIAAVIPPLVPFGEADYAGALWVIDWDHRPPGLGDLEPTEWSPPCESGHVRWAVDVWYLLTFNGMIGEGRAFLVDLVERNVVRERDFQFRAG